MDGHRRVAAELRGAAVTLAAKVEHEYAALGTDQRFELRGLSTSLLGWADRLDPDGAPVVYPTPASVTRLATRPAPAPEPVA